MMHFETGRVAIEVEDCNQGGAEVGISPTTLQVRPMVMTDQACTGAPAEVEAAI
ncbi:MAG: META domain-containing protein, partial [Ilumatobacteraceae bacterium]